MNRTIKFRVWDHGEERFIEWFNADPMINCNNGDVFCYERQYDETGKCIGDDLIHTAISKRNLTLQQFTGLLDIEGKEIFEGDILSLSNGGWDEGEKPEPTITAVRFENGAYRLDLSGEVFGDADELLDELLCLTDTDKHYIDGTVIGNIFEHKNFLK